jgi:adenylate kinase family enzyme
MVQKAVDEEANKAQEEIERIKKHFHYLKSKEGIIEDEMVNTYDLINHANKPPLSILLIGIPRAGKTNTAKNLSKELDLVHVNVKNYIEVLLKKIANYEPPDDLEEGQEPPKFLTDLEEEVHQALKSGKGPNDSQMVRILHEMITSPEAQTKGYVINLPYYPREETWAETITNGSLGIHEDGFSYVVEISTSDADVKRRAKGIRVDPETGEIVSEWERKERKKKKIKK